MSQKIDRIPLAQRLRGAIRAEERLPYAMGLCDVDFYGEVGTMTAQEERYQSIYEEKIKPYRGVDDAAMVRIYELVARADELEDSDRQDLLFWLLVEPFAAIQNQQNKQNNERKDI